MGEQERSPKKLNQNNQEFEQKTNQNGFIKDSNGLLYLPKDYLSEHLPKDYLSERDKKPSWLLKPRKGGKTYWDWLGLLFVPALIATIAGTFTLITVSQQNKISRQQNKIFEQRDEAEKDRNQQGLLIKYLDDISELVEKQLLTLNDDENSKTQRTIARGRTFSVLRALDSDRRGELIQFLSITKLIEKDKPIIGLNQANLERANLKYANLERANLKDTNLKDANLEDANLEDANLERANLERANLESANLKNANLKNANLKNANLESANLKYANLKYANLKYANLKDANLKDANLKDANLESADLESANLERADLFSANLILADLEGADLGGANLEDADLGGANLEDANLESAIGLNPTKVKAACNWEKASFSKEFQQKLAQEPDQEVDCSHWD